MVNKIVTAKLDTRHLTEYGLSYLVNMLVIPKNIIKFPAFFLLQEKKKQTTSTEQGG